MKQAKDHGHINTILEGEMIIANEHKYGFYPTCKIPCKCTSCMGNLMLVTNVGNGMKVCSRDDPEFENLGSQTLRVGVFFLAILGSNSQQNQCNSCQLHHPVVLGFTVNELISMPIIQSLLPLWCIVINSHFIGPGSPLSLLPLEVP